VNIAEIIMEKYCIKFNEPFKFIGDSDKDLYRITKEFRLEATDCYGDWRDQNWHSINASVLLRSEPKITKFKIVG